MRMRFSVGIGRPTTWIGGPSNKLTITLVIVLTELPSTLPQERISTKICWDNEKHIVARKRCRLYLVVLVMHLQNMVEWRDGRPGSEPTPRQDNPLVATGTRRFQTALTTDGNPHARAPKVQWGHTIRSFARFFLFFGNTPDRFMTLA